MGILSSIFGTSDEKVTKMCIKLYNKAKQMRPGKNERDYLKIVLLTKPPFDYQEDEIINITLNSCNNIEDLARMICEFGKNGSDLWEYREENIKSGHLKSRNQAFFSEFWG